MRGSQYTRLIPGLSENWMAIHVKTAVFSEHVSNTKPMAKITTNMENMFHKILTFEPKDKLFCFRCQVLDYICVGMDINLPDRDTNDVGLTSMRRHVASTSVRHHVPAEFLAVELEDRKSSLTDLI